MCNPQQVLGDRVLRPFLQDTILFWPLTAAMAGTLLAAPLTIARVLCQARPLMPPLLSILLSFMCHFWTPEPEGSGFGANYASPWLKPAEQGKKVSPSGGAQITSRH